MASKLLSVILKYKYIVLKSHEQAIKYLQLWINHKGTSPVSSSLDIHALTLIPREQYYFIGLDNLTWRT